MSDFEKKLGDALMSGADDAPGAEGLAHAARSRSRRRRRTVVAVAAAAVVAAVAVPVGVVALRDGGSAPDTAKDPAPPTLSDTRIETWHDIQVEVPASWGYGPRSTWCIDGKVDLPVVERPGGVVATIACETTYSFGVTFGSSAAASFVYPSGSVWQYEAGDVEEYLPGSWVGYWYDGDDLVQVNAADEETVQAIVDSVERVDSVDANGCPVEREEGFTTESEQLSVCRYDADYRLEQSELLSAEDTAAAISALEAAPAGDPELPASCAQDQLPYLVVDMITTDLNSAVAIQAPCPYKPGITSGGESFQDLTEDVLYWALSPGWSGSVSGGVPLPQPLRALPKAEPAGPTASAESPCPEGYFANSDFALDPDNGEPIAVCRMEVSYGAESGGTYLLADTTDLTQGESDAVRAAVAAAPVVEEEEADFKLCNTGPGEFFLVLAGDAVPLWVYNAECGDHYAITRAEDGAVIYHQVTQELLDALGSSYGLLR